MIVTIYTPKNKLFDKLEATAVYLPAAKGDMQILNNHVPLITSLREGTIVIDTANKDKVSVEVDTGYVQFADNVMTVLIQETKLTTQDLERLAHKAIGQKDTIIEDDESITEKEFEDNTDSRR